MSLIPAAELRRPAADLVLASFTVLFLELALIRWLPGQVRVLAYFPNLVLISAFLGLGLGAIRVGSRSLLPWWPVLLLLLMGVGWALGNVAFTSRSTSEHLWLLYYDIPDAPIINDIRPPILVVFCLCALVFLPLGQIVGARLREFSEKGETLAGYAFDLVGSLLGVIGFSFASWGRTFPLAWFAVVLVTAAWFFVGSIRRIAGYGLGAAAILVLVGASERADVYSPYYALKAVRVPGSSGVEILANGSLHQYAAPLGGGDVVDVEYHRKIREGYPIPYENLARPPRRVLVLGAGTGNDVATALKHTGAAIDAVEIDPVILDLGRRLHPDRPYASDRVRVITDDARAFLRNTDLEYDLIVFGTLDSMTRLSAMSNVRLDNFVYTIESLRAARERLSPGGGIALYFMVANPEIHWKLAAILTEVFGEPPLIWRGDHQLFNEIFLAGPAWDHLRAEVQGPAREEVYANVVRADVPVDDWPYLYLEGRSLPSFYVGMLVILSLVSIAGVWLAAPEMRRQGLRGFDAEMFLFGFAFLLLETKLVTQMAVVYGATWITSAVVFGSILLMILIGTILMQKRPVSHPLAAAGLVLALLANWAVPTDVLLAESVWARLALSILFVGAPIFFASILFAIRFATRTASNAAFGWNLLGAVFGGLLEFSSMLIGLRALSLVALIGYLVAFVIGGRRPAPGPPSSRPLPERETI
ncbi:MAG TPA: hypothetical protein VMS56_15615 [Thermoanaerobaculia bacterium]|nr:hypothetical protein [Thermoanaerobaculia bacterium]